MRPCLVVLPQYVDEEVIPLRLGIKYHGRLEIEKRGDKLFIVTKEWFERRGKTNLAIFLLGTLMILPKAIKERIHMWRLRKKGVKEYLVPITGTTSESDWHDTRVFDARRDC